MGKGTPKVAAEETSEATPVETPVESNIDPVNALPEATPEVIAAQKEAEAQADATFKAASDANVIAHAKEDEFNALSEEEKVEAAQWTVEEAIAILRFAIHRGKPGATLKADRIKYFQVDKMINALDEIESSSKI